MHTLRWILVGHRHGPFLHPTIDFLDRTMEELYHANDGRLRMTGPALKVLGASVFGKALKTLDAIRLLCESGYGEDAMILARSLVNLAINLGYIGRAPDPDERASDFVASGRIARRDFLRQFPQHPADWRKDVEWAALEERAKRWDGIRIRDRAHEAGMDDFYREFYRFGSSYEHSDSASLSGYFGASDETNQEIDADPSDDLVDLVIGCTFKAMAVLTEILVAGFRLDEAERIGKLRAAFAQLGADRQERT
jgi:hypothetical protein